MASKLLDENKQHLCEKRHFKSFQLSSVPSRTKTGQKVVPTSPVDERELDRQTEEESLQEPLKRLEEKNRKLIKEKNIISEGRELAIQQEKILKDMQIKINQLQKQLKHPELIGSRGREKVCSCPIFPTQKRAMVKQTQKPGCVKNICFCLGNSVWLFVRYLLYCGCLYLTLLLVYKHLPDPTGTYPNSICRQSWTH